MVAPRRELEGEWRFQATQIALCIAQQHGTLRGAQGKPGAAMVAPVVRRALPAGHPLPWGQPRQRAQMEQGSLQCTHTHSPISPTMGDRRGDPRSISCPCSQSLIPLIALVGARHGPRSTKRVAGPQPLLSACWVVFFPLLGTNRQLLLANRL